MEWFNATFVFVIYYVACHCISEHMVSTFLLCTVESRCNGCKIVSTHVQAQLDTVTQELSEATAEKGSAQESAEVMRDKAEQAEAEVTDLRTKLLEASCTAAEEVRKQPFFMHAVACLSLPGVVLLGKTCKGAVYDPCTTVKCILASVGEAAWGS
jgi:hypothetical protein